MRTTLASGLHLEYETFGNRASPAILLIMGLGAQLTVWPEAFCRDLAAAGFHVIRYDNRDVGLSSRLENFGRPRTVRAGLGYKLGLPIRAGYTLDDMALDAVQLLDALGIAKAHVLGASMGGMIAQILGAKHRERVLSLTLVMTSRGGRRAAGPPLKVALRLMKRPKSQDREVQIAYSMQTWRLVGSREFLPPPEVMREMVARQIDRSFDPAGVARQMMAIFASAGRKELLGTITAPTLILHGAIDPLIPVEGAFDLVKRIPGATLEVVPGMGHDLPPALLPRLTASVLRHITGDVQQKVVPLRAPRRGLLPVLGWRRRESVDELSARA